MNLYISANVEILLIICGRIDSMRRTTNHEVRSRVLIVIH